MYGRGNYEKILSVGSVCVMLTAQLLRMWSGNSRLFYIPSVFERVCGFDWHGGIDDHNNKMSLYHDLHAGFRTLL